MPWTRLKPRINQGIRNQRYQYLNKRTIGQATEEMACNFLISRGGRILEKNYRCKQGEIDIIAADGRYICFIEVKYRQNNRYGEPSEALTASKIQHICKVSKFYLYSKYKSYDLPVRYDVIAISPEEKMLTFKWIKNAFDCQ